MAIKHLYYRTSVIEIHELEQLAFAFPNVFHLRIDSEDCLESKLNLKLFKNLTKLYIGVLASDEFKGEVDEEEDDPEYMFQL